MLADLSKKYFNSKISRDSLKSILCVFKNVNDSNVSELSMSLYDDYGFDIDPVYWETLVIKFNISGFYESYEIVKSE